MKRVKPTIIYKAKKGKAKKTEARMHLLFFLLFLTAGIILFDKFPFFIKPVGIEKVFALQDVQDASFFLSPTPTPVAPPVLSLQSFVDTTPTPTSAQQTILDTQTESDFCLNVPMLIYHHIQPLDEANSLGHAQLTVDSGIFDEQMNYLVSNGYHTISSDQVVTALINHQQLPEKSIVITLDDGYDDVYNYAYGIAKKYNIVLDLMIPSGLVNNAGYLTWDQLKEMSENNLIHVYNHTWSHAALGDADRAQIEQEVMTANSQLEATLNKKINIFSYPYGSYGTTVIDFLKERGFVGGISTIDGTVQCKSYIMTLHRTHIGNAPLSVYGF